MIIERLSQEHRNIEKLLAILDRELEGYSRMLKFFGKMSTPLFAISSCTSGTT
jgi:hypothetical protein